MAFTVDQKVVHTTRPGVWSVIESDEHMTKISRLGKGAVLVATKSLTLAPADAEETVIKTFEKLAPEALNHIAANLSRSLGLFATPDAGKRMAELGFTEPRLYRDMLAEVFARMSRAGIDVAEVTADALDLVGNEELNTGMIEGASRLKTT